MIESEEVWVGDKRLLRASPCQSPMNFYIEQPQPWRSREMKSGGMRFERRLLVTRSSNIAYITNLSAFEPQNTF